jgi:hypothetical protein
MKMGCCGVSQYLPDYMAQHPRRQPSSSVFWLHEVHIILQNLKNVLNKFSFYLNWATCTTTLYRSPNIFLETFQQILTRTKNAADKILSLQEIMITNVEYRSNA